MHIVQNTIPHNSTAEQPEPADQCIFVASVQNDDGWKFMITVASCITSPPSGTNVTRSTAQVQMSRFTASFFPNENGFTSQCYVIHLMLPWMKCTTFWSHVKHRFRAITCWDSWVTQVSNVTDALQRAWEITTEHIESCDHHNVDLLSIPTCHHLLVIHMH